MACSEKHAQPRESQNKTGQADDSSYFAKILSKTAFFFFFSMAVFIPEFTLWCEIVDVSYI